MNRLISLLLVSVALIAGVAFELPGVARAELIGDLDGNCVVNFNDALMVARNIGYSEGSLRYSETLDLNHNGRIDFFDLQIVASHWGEHC